jgi:hypothetical protein
MRGWTLKLLTPKSKSVNLFKSKFKLLIGVAIFLYVGVTVYINFSQKKVDLPVKTQSPSNKEVGQVAKPDEQENLEKLKKLKALELKLNQSRKKHADALSLRDIISVQIQLNINLVKTEQIRINHLMVLFNEGALNDQDLELAKAKLKEVETTIQKMQSDSVILNNFIEQHAKTLAQEESEFNLLKLR